MNSPTTSRLRSTSRDQRRHLSRRRSAIAEHRISIFADILFVADPNRQAGVSPRQVTPPTPQSKAPATLALHDTKYVVVQAAALYRASVLGSLNP